MRDEVTSDATGEATSDVTWMSYADLGSVRGISAASAKRLAIRRHWRRHQGNDGTARVAVPVTEASPREAKPGDDTGDVTGNSGLLAGALAALEGAVSGLREQLDATNARAERAEARAGELRNQLDAREGDLSFVRTVLDRTQAEARAARERAETLQREDDARKARGLLARLGAAVRGR
jgi:hypothetical protein